MKELAGPFELLPGCRLWLAVFGPQHDASASRDVELAENELSKEDFRRWQRYRAPEKRRQFLNSRRIVREVILSESELCFAAEHRLKAACGFSHRDRHGDDSFTPLSAGAATAHGASGARRQRPGSTQSTAADRATDRNVHFCSDASGRPLVLGPSGEEMCSISLSHSGNVVAVAVSELPDRIGVDVEVVSPLNEAALMNSAATTEELAWISRQPASGCAELLRTLWVMKESVWKTLPTAGEMSLADVRVDFANRSLQLSGLATNNRDFEWNTALFVLNCTEVSEQTSTIVHPLAGGVAVRGCLARQHGSSVTPAILTDATP